MAPDGPLGDINRDSGRTTLHFVRSLAHPPERVWRALTESEHMRWWMPADMIGEKAAGATVSMVFWEDLVDKMGLDPDGGTATIQVWDPPHVFQWLWHGSLVRFEIKAFSGGSRLDLKVEIDTDDPDTIIDNAGGFHLWVEHLETLLSSGSSAPIADADPRPLQARYRVLLDVG